MNPRRQLHEMRAPEEVRSAVHEMAHAPGWPHYCAVYERKMAEIALKVMNPRTPAEETLLLKRVHEHLAFFRPETLANELMTGATNEIRRLEQEKTS